MKLSMFSKLFALSLVNFAMLSNYGYAQSKVDLIKLVEAYRSQISDIDFNYTFESVRLAEDPTRKDKVYIPKMDIRIKYQDNKQFLEYKAWNRKENKASQHDIFVYNSKYSSQYNKSGKTGSIYPTRTEGAGMHNYIYEALMWPTSPSDKARVSPITDLLVLIELDNTKILSKKETIFETETIILDCSDGNIKVWLDIEHGAIPRKIEIRQGSGGIMRQLYEIPELHEVDGIFFPEKVTKELFAGPSAPKEMHNTVTWRFNMIVPQENLKINTGLKEEDFEIDFPPGTAIHDLVNNTTYTIGSAADSPGEVLDHFNVIKIEEQESKTNNTNNNTEDSIQAHKFSNHLIWLFCGIAIFFGLIIFGFIKTRR